MKRTVELRYKRPKLYPKQKAAIFNDSRYSLVEASTKSGKTVGCMVWLAEKAFQGKRGWNYWWVAPVQNQAAIAFNRLKPGGVNEIPKDIVSKVINSPGKESITLINGAIIRFFTAEKPDNLYGEDVYAAVLDEATRMRLEAWIAVRSTLTATGGPIRIIGNVKGRKNWAYQLARKAESGEPGMEYHKITAHDAIEAGIFDKAELEDARQQLPENIFQELYMAEPGDDEGNPFGIDAIRSKTGKLGNPNDICVWGWDLAKSVDWTMGVGLDPSNTVCIQERFQQPWEDTFRRILARSGNTPSLVDSTGVGDPILERLQREGGENFEGYHFSPSSKQKLMEGLAVAIQRGPIRYPEGGPIQAELESFEYEYTRTGVRYSAPEGLHDDCVCALALAVEHNSHAVVGTGVFF